MQIDSLAVATLLVGMIGAGGIGSLWRRFVMSRPEATSILINSAGELVVIQKQVITDLQAEVIALRNELAQVRAERNSLEARVTALETELHDERSKRQGG